MTYCDVSMTSVSYVIMWPAVPSQSPHIATSQTHGGWGLAKTSLWRHMVTSHDDLLWRFNDVSQLRHNVTGCSVTVTSHCDVADTWRVRTRKNVIVTSHGDVTWWPTVTSQWRQSVTSKCDRLFRHSHLTLRRRRHVEGEDSQKRHCDVTGWCHMMTYCDVSMTSVSYVIMWPAVPSQSPHIATSQTRGGWGLAKRYCDVTVSCHNVTCCYVLSTSVIYIILWPAVTSRPPHIVTSQTRGGKGLAKRCCDVTVSCHNVTCCYVSSKSVI